jgi:hypothetical protein
MTGAATERQRRWRKRQRACEVIVPVRVTHAIIAVLLDLGWLTDRDSEDRAQIGAALDRMLDDLAPGGEANKP